MVDSARDLVDMMRSLPADGEAPDAETAGALMDTIDPMNRIDVEPFIKALQAGGAGCRSCSDQR